MPKGNRGQRQRGTFEGGDDFISLGGGSRSRGGGHSRGGRGKNRGRGRGRGRSRGRGAVQGNEPGFLTQLIRANQPYSSGEDDYVGHESFRGRGRGQNRGRGRGRGRGHDFSHVAYSYASRPPGRRDDLEIEGIYLGDSDSDVIVVEDNNGEDTESCTELAMDDYLKNIMSSIRLDNTGEQQPHDTNAQLESLARENERIVTSMSMLHGLRDPYGYADNSAGESGSSEDEVPVREPAPLTGQQTSTYSSAAGPSWLQSSFIISSAHTLEGEELALEDMRVLNDDKHLQRSLDNTAAKKQNIARPDPTAGPSWLRDLPNADASEKICHTGFATGPSWLQNSGTDTLGTHDTAVNQSLDAITIDSEDGTATQVKDSSSLPPVFFVDTAGTDSETLCTEIADASKIARDHLAGEELIILEDSSDDTDSDDDSDDGQIRVWKVPSTLVDGAQYILDDDEDSDDSTTQHFCGQFSWRINTDDDDDDGDDDDDMLDASAREKARHIDEMVDAFSGAGGLDARGGTSRATRRQFFKEVLNGDFSHADPVFSKLQGQANLEKHRSNSPRWAMTVSELDDDDDDDYDDDYNEEGIFAGSASGAKSLRARRAERRKNEQLLSVTKKSKKELQREKRERKKEKQRKQECRRTVNLREINGIIRGFVMDRSLSSIPLPPMDRKARCAVHQIALQYNLNSKSTGSGNRRYTILTRKIKTALPVNGRIVDHIIRQYNQQTMYENGALPALGGKKAKGKQSRDNWGNRDGLREGGRNPDAARPKPGTVVGGNVPAISSSNIGHQLLSKMGWTPGESLGKDKAGRVDPVEAIVRSSRRGLGHG
ncbi:hypothetical protein THASP1DRAFT_31900 [Thamnocephalis sphaerospora]|uniref:Protein SQS1 n=1 Tax=Thamnocephalis sphaerospora TaxID=78915 RepID=A0A4V1IW45_9FUNG|nr:hypothetical protein THASP1DRAFT_31900 [Thamnocephalis sphaerospora]|eukprot:RKP06279.1 hypothetical protein THASP1DRAFT_31900 [Thamnocephalis sphaerospora]